MRIRFESTIDSVIAFHRFHYANSPSRRRQIWLLAALGPAVFIVILPLALVSTSAKLDADDPALWLIGVCDSVVMLAISIGWIFFVRWFMSWHLVRTARTLLAEGPNKIMLGWREMELVNGRLVVNAELIQRIVDLRAIHKIVSDGNYTYVYTDSLFAYTIPMRLYPEAEYRQFIAELREAWENREIALPPDGDSSKPRQVDERIVER
jgi:hypothetical protein